jgi:beta-xylosidase
MRRLSLLLVTLIFGLAVLFPVRSAGHGAGEEKQAVWSPDNGDGTYKNPIIFADYSDPDVIRVGGDFYLVASSFNCSPGLPVLHSKDLVNWKIIGHVFQKYPQESFNRPQHGNGVWAPSIRYHEGEYYVYFGDPDLGIFMAKTRNPAGQWEPLVHVQKARGWIDTCPFWDDDGTAYLVHAWAKSRAGINSILTINRMSGDGKRLLDEGKLVFDGHAHHPTMEGPKLYKRNGYYYIFAPAGGVATGWQAVLRAKNIYGPYEDRIVMDQGRTNINGPHQGGWVELDSGESWFIHFQDRGAYGRLVHSTAQWVDDWPVIGVDPDGDGKGAGVDLQGPNVGRRYPVATQKLAMNSRPMSPDCSGMAVPIPGAMDVALGAFRLAAPVLDADSGTGGQSLVRAQSVAAKLPAPRFSVTTKLDFNHLAPGEKAGLVMFGMDYSFLAVEKTGSGFRLIKTSCKNAITDGQEKLESQVQLSGSTVLLRVTVSSGALCQFSYSLDGGAFVPAGGLFTAREGRWVGARVGLFALAKGGSARRGYADFDWFRLE